MGDEKINIFGVKWGTDFRVWGRTRLPNLFEVPPSQPAI